MIKTDFKEFLHDLEETVTAFVPLEQLEIEVDANLNSKQIDNFEVKVKIQDKTYFDVYTLNETDKIIEKRFKKRYLKTTLYKGLSDFLNKTLAWGSMTGIRPTKMAYQSLERNGEFENYFNNELFVSPEKTEIVKKILQAQKPFYTLSDDNSDFFVGIPFCPSRCLYCSFVSCEISKEKHLNEYIEALISEINGSKRFVKNLRSVYIGGGTPVSLSASQFTKILEAIGNPHVEYTVEAGRPDCIDEEKLQIMKDFGVTRVCVNPQTFSNATLERLSRKHTSEDVFEKYAMTKKFGFDVNMDLIAGLTGETFEVFKDSVDKAIALEPENITIHTLSLKRGSKLKESVDRLSDGDIVKMVDYAAETLDKNGYNPYYLYRQKYMAGNLENTGFSKPGKECIYNIDIMEEIAQIVACGANSVSKRVIGGENRIERYGAPKDIATYNQKIETILENKRLLFEAK